MLSRAISMFNSPIIRENFIKACNGYHLITEKPIKEAVWEDINETVLKQSGCSVSDSANGSHKSGCDIVCEYGKLSNKSTKIKNNKFSISSYRLSSVCSDRNVGNISDIIAEINNRKNFDYYSLLLREEEEKKINYKWYMLPCDFQYLNPEKYEWEKKMGSRKNNKDKQLGWKTNVVDGCYMDITFSMSSQLWIHMGNIDLNQYLISECCIDLKDKTFINLIELYETASFKFK
jgi:hypothetical protein